MPMGFLSIEERGRSPWAIVVIANDTFRGGEGWNAITAAADCRSQRASCRHVVASIHRETVRGKVRGCLGWGRVAMRVPIPLPDPRFSWWLTGTEG